MIAASARLARAEEKIENSMLVEFIFRMQINRIHLVIQLNKVNIFIAIFISNTKLKPLYSSTKKRKV